MNTLIVGHKEVVDALSAQLPPVSIITGPPSVGKRIIATYAALQHNVSRVDFTEVKTLTVEEASRVKSFVSVKPSSNYRFVLLDLDRASHSAIDKLLITLENPPEAAKFSLISSGDVPRTLRTRAENYYVGLLGKEELLSVLIQQGIPVDQAARYCHLGRVDAALAAYNSSTNKALSLNILQAVQSGDYILFMQAYKSADTAVADMIVTAWQEAASGCWKLFDKKQLGGFANPQVALKMLATWSTMSGARSTFAVRTTLETVLRS